MSFVLVNTDESKGLLLDSLRISEEISVDTETTDLDPLLGTLRLVQINLDGQVFILDVKDITRNYLTEVVSLIKERDIPVIYHNSKFDVKFLYTHTGVFLDNTYDTQMVESLITAGVGKPYYSLAELVEKYCGKVLEKAVRKEFAVSDIITQEMLIYSAKDVLYLPEIRKKQMEVVNKWNMHSVLELESNLLPVVTLMELDGIGFDSKRWSEIYYKTLKEKEKLDEELLQTLINTSFNNGKYSNALEFFNALNIPVRTKKLTTYLEEITEPHFIIEEGIRKINLGSHKQLKACLNLSGIPVENTTKGELGRYTDNSIVNTLLRMKHLYKRTTTYGLDYFKHIHPLTNRIHPEANQVGTRTGRFAYINPNPQQMPTDVEDGVAIYRACFIADPGNLLYTVDYSQAELRLAGAISGETRIIEAYKKGIDIHSLTASLIFHKNVEDITKEERNIGKTINFSILYGSTAYGINQKNPDIPLHEAERLLENFFNGYPKLSAFLDAVSEVIWERKYSTTPLGRKRFFENKVAFDEPWQFLKYKSEVIREGKNTIIQGCSADALKMAMVRIAKENPFSHEELAIRIQIHDELVIEVKEDIKDEAKAFIDMCMIESEQIFLGEIPAEVEGHFSKYWTK